MKAIIFKPILSRQQQSQIILPSNTSNISFLLLLLFFSSCVVFIALAVKGYNTSPCLCIYIIRTVKKFSFNVFSPYSLSLCLEYLRICILHTIGDIYWKYIALPFVWLLLFCFPSMFALFALFVCLP